MGLLLFIVPGIIIAVRLSFYCFFIVLDDLKPVDALKKSAQVTKEYSWRLANAVIIIGSLLIVSLLLTQLFLHQIGLYNLYFGTLVDSLFSILGWLSLILVFRFYCLYKEKVQNEIKPPPVNRDILA
jgi:membrane-anchored glycerophosphoryl diester phosphodiesterase (GDPDase)